MKTLRTALITFGLTSIAYGIFAMLTVAIDPAFAGRSIYSLFSDTGFPALAIGFACVLAVILISVTLVALRPKKAKRPNDEADFLENETVPVEEYERQYAPVVRKKAPRPQRTPAEELSADELPDETSFRPQKNAALHCIFCGSKIPEGSDVCPKCGKSV